VSNAFQRWAAALHLFGQRAPAPVVTSMTVLRGSGSDEVPRSSVNSAWDGVQCSHLTKIGYPEKIAAGRFRSSSLQIVRPSVLIQGDW